MFSATVYLPNSTTGCGKRRNYLQVGERVARVREREGRGERTRERGEERGQTRGASSLKQGRRGVSKMCCRAERGYNNRGNRKMQLAHERTHTDTYTHTHTHTDSHTHPPTHA